MRMSIRATHVLPSLPLAAECQIDSKFKGNKATCSCFGKLNVRRDRPPLVAGGSVVALKASRAPRTGQAANSD